MNVYDSTRIFHCHSETGGIDEGEGWTRMNTRSAICEGSRLECGLNYDLNGVGSLCGCRVLRPMIINAAHHDDRAACCAAYCAALPAARC